jgi:hypothetical protein
MLPLIGLDCRGMAERGRLTRFGHGLARQALDRAAEAGNAEAVATLGWLAERRGEVDEAPGFYRGAATAGSRNAVRGLEWQANRGRPAALEFLDDSAESGNPRRSPRSVGWPSNAVTWPRRTRSSRGPTRPRRSGTRGSPRAATSTPRTGLLGHSASLGRDSRVVRPASVAAWLVVG